MFCGTAPCSCKSKKEVPKPEPKVIEHEPAVEPEIHPTASVPRVKYSNKISMNVPKFGQASDTMSYAVGVLILSGIVHEDDVERLRSSVGRVADVDTKKRIREWKVRNGEA